MRAVGQALSAHLSTVLSTLMRALSHVERTWWKARSVAAAIVAALCGVEACHSGLYSAQVTHNCGQPVCDGEQPEIGEMHSCWQAQLQVVLKALMSDQMAEVRQNARLAAHALATMSNGEVRRC